MNRSRPSSVWHFSFDHCYLPYDYHVMTIILLLNILRSAMSRDGVVSVVKVPKNEPDRDVERENDLTQICGVVCGCLWVDSIVHRCVRIPSYPLSTSRSFDVDEPVRGVRRVSIDTCDKQSFGLHTERRMGAREDPE
jgi:hypothetical protein